jgi:hypothetical protein
MYVSIFYYVFIIEGVNAPSGGHTEGSEAEGERPDLVEVVVPDPICFSGLGVQGFGLRDPLLKQMIDID